MGCFSSRCLKCHKGVVAGSECIIFLLIDGKVVEQMQGKYDNYGAVERVTGSSILFVPSLLEDGLKDYLDETIKSTGGYEYNDAFIWEYDKWRNICSLNFKSIHDNDGHSRSYDGGDSGFAYYHKECYEGEIPTYTSNSDPNQGWGENTVMYLHSYDDQITALYYLIGEYKEIKLNVHSFPKEFLIYNLQYIFDGFEKIFWYTYYFYEPEKLKEINYKEIDKYLGHPDQTHEEYKEKEERNSFTVTTKEDQLRVIKELRDKYITDLRNGKERITHNEIIEIYNSVFKDFERVLTFSY